MNSRYSILWVVSVILLSCSVMGGDSESLIGKTEAQITEKMGEPKSVMDMGDYRVLGYPGVMVEIRNGKVVKTSAAVVPSPDTTPSSSATPSKSEATESSTSSTSAAEEGAVLELSFTAVDGTQVDLKNYRGKVVLVDFWATWCGPCVGEIPHVLEAYKKYHSQGFEVIGISLDKDKGKLTSFLAEKGMTWPQYFDGKGWNNEISKKHGINGIPAMWLIDKQGRVASKNARKDLDKVVAQALAQ